jgi:beta-galactosidase
MRCAALLLLLFALPLPASEPAPRRHLTIGAEIIDDPVASPEKVDAWFQLLADNQMPLARIFIPHGEEQLRRMDWFFRAAERHHVGISATLGGSPSPSNAAWIKEGVQRYKDSPALDSWILANEPTHAPEATEPAVAQFRAWLKGKYGSVERLNETWESHHASFDEITPVTRGQRTNFRPFNDWYAFWRTYLAVQLEWIAQQVRAVDSVHPTHTNPHEMIGNLASGSLDLPPWRGFLSTLGFTCHPSWHFGLLRRDQFTLGISYLAEVIRGSIEPKPFWVTELQGGVNTISSNRPLYPFKEDLAQWLWTSFGAGADRVIFWLLNNRSWGVESGEWSLLDLQNQPSERLETAGKVARVINQHAALFDSSHAAESPITVILSLETMTQQEWAAQAWTVTSTEAGKTTRAPGRDRGAHVLAALAYFQTLSEMGIPARIKHIHDYDWQTKSAERRLAILPNVAVLSREQADNIEALCATGTPS